MRFLWLVIVLSFFDCVHHPEKGFNASNGEQKEVTGSTFIHGVRVFDGQQVWPQVNVLLARGRIAGLGVDLSQPEGATLVEGAGKTLLPGFIDAHAHVWNQAQLDQASIFGTTTVLDMGCADPAIGRALRARADKPNSTSADLRFAGYAVTAPGGHCTEYGFVVPTLSTPLEARAFVKARVSDGSDYIKVIYDSGQALGLKFNTLDKTTLKATIEAAHELKKMAIVHIGSQSDAREAIELGADGLAHIFMDSAVTPEFEKTIRSQNAFVIPTLRVNQSVAGAASEDLSRVAQFTAYLTDDARSQLARTFPALPDSHLNFSWALASTQRMHQLGSAVLVGTDAPNPGTSLGVSLHAELALLVEAGLTPLEALASATQLPAGAFGLNDRGSIRAGLRADVVLVNGDPTTEIKATRDIAAVWRGGRLVDRDSYRTQIEAQQPQKQPAKDLMLSRISSFDKGSLTSAFGQGWSVTTDALRGGKSMAQQEVSTDGAELSQGALRIWGTVAPGLPFAWAGVMFSPGEKPMAPADLSKKKKLVFWAKGQPGIYQVMFFAKRRGFAPSVQKIALVAAWKKFELAFSNFDGLDGSDTLGIAWVAGPQPGPFEFSIDDVQLQ